MVRIRMDVLPSIECISIYHKMGKRIECSVDSELTDLAKQI